MKQLKNKIPLELKEYNELWINTLNKYNEQLERDVLSLVVNKKVERASEWFVSSNEYLIPKLQLKIKSILEFNWINANNLNILMWW